MICLSISHTQLEIFERQRLCQADSPCISETDMEDQHLSAPQWTINSSSEPALNLLHLLRCLIRFSVHLGAITIIANLLHIQLS